MEVHINPNPDIQTKLQVALVDRTVFQMDQPASAVKAFYGTGANTVKTQLWIAASI
jgi:hypothetical protein